MAEDGGSGLDHDQTFWFFYLINRQIKFHFSQF
jgi:hypothetical protein